MILVTVVSTKEAHSAGTALKGFVDGDIHRDQLMLTVEEQTFCIADAATFAGVFAAIALRRRGRGSALALDIVLLAVALRAPAVGANGRRQIPCHLSVPLA